MSTETENSNFFQHSREITLSKIIEPQPNSNLKLLIPKMYLYVKFKLNVYNHLGDNERKLKISFFFQSSRGITLLAIIKPQPNLYFTSYSYEISIC
jgi:hypothetical protein